MGEGRTFPHVSSAIILTGGGFMSEKAGNDAGSAARYLLLGLGLGLAAGFAAGLLLAPKPGSETRSEVKEAIRTAAEALKDRMAAASDGKADVGELAEELS